MRCERCNDSRKPAARCLVAKPGAEVERVLCKDCRELTRQVYPVTVVEEAPEGQETAQDGPQAASGGATAPKGRRARAVHKEGPHGGAALCGMSKGIVLAVGNAEVTCRRCLAIMAKE